MIVAVMLGDLLRQPVEFFFRIGRCELVDWLHHKPVPRPLAQARGARLSK